MPLEKGYLVFCFTVLLSILFISPVPAFKQEDLDKLKSTKRCEKCVLNGVDLSLANLSEAYLYKANLSGAKLDGAILYHTKMPDGRENNSGCKK